MWAQIINTIIGIWLMAAPSYLAYNSPGENNCHIVGPVIATFAIVAYWEATRGVRKFNYPLGFWLLLSPWVLGYESTLPIINDMLCGIFVLVFSSVKGKIEGNYGGGWKAIWEAGGLEKE